ncbi:MAG: hypothetical protein R2719_04110 [Micropruina sp.]
MPSGIRRYGRNRAAGCGSGPWTESWPRSDTRPAVSTGSTGEDATFVGDGPEPGLEVIATGPLHPGSWTRAVPAGVAIGVGRRGAALSGLVARSGAGQASAGLPPWRSRSADWSCTPRRPRLIGSGHQPTAGLGSTSDRAVHAGPLCLRAGQTLAAPRGTGCAPTSVAGGFAVPPVLGSASTDTLPKSARPGPGPVIGCDRTGPSPPPLTGRSSMRPSRSAPELWCWTLPGPRADWLAERRADPAGVAGVRTQDRAGIRLEGDPLARHLDRRGDELPSEPMVRGAIQVPPTDGR